MESRIKICRYSHFCTFWEILDMKRFFPRPWLLFIMFLALKLIIFHIFVFSLKKEKGRKLEHLRAVIYLSNIIIHMIFIKILKRVGCQVIYTASLYEFSFRSSSLCIFANTKEIWVFVFRARIIPKKAIVIE